MVAVLNDLPPVNHKTAAWQRSPGRFPVSAAPMSISDCALASWRKASSRGSALLFAACPRAVERGRGRADVHADVAAQHDSVRHQRTPPTASRSPRSAATRTYTYTLKPGDSLPPGLITRLQRPAERHADHGEQLHLHLTATDNGGDTGFRPYTFSIGTPGGITIHPASPLPDGTQACAYNQTLTATAAAGRQCLFRQRRLAAAPVCRSAPAA